MSLPLPAPRLLDPAAVRPLRWGVVGTGIATRLVEAVHAHTPQRVVAWTARDPERTQAVARAHGVERCHPDVAALVADPDVDAVYVATPHTLHREHALAAIAAGKHVLVEKPMATNAADAEAITSAARAAGVLAMEAMWTRYLPQTDVLRQVLADGLLGDVHLVRADFGFVAPYDAAHRLWDPALGGGALLDVGVYPVNLASLVLGRPGAVVAVGTLAPTGVDATAALLLSHDDGSRALLSTSLTTSLPATALVAGSAGHVAFPDPFWAPSELTVRLEGDDEPRTWAHPHPAGVPDGFAFQVTAFAHHVEQGLLESPLQSHAETVSVLATLDEARRQVAAS